MRVYGSAELGGGRDVIDLANSKLIGAPRKLLAVELVDGHLVEFKLL